MNINVTYDLSNAQRKELFDRSRVLMLAIPAPINSDEWDAGEFARKSLPDVPAKMIAAVWDVVCVSPMPSHGAEMNGLTDCLGHIVDQEAAERTFHYVAEVAIVTVTPERPRHGPTKLNWPMSATTLAGWRWPKAKASTGTGK